MAKDVKTDFIQLCKKLQDPHLVAKFQQFCGVRGTFPRKSSETSVRELERFHNGGCTNYCPNEDENGEGDGCGSDGTRRRKITAEENSAHYDCTDGLVNGTAARISGASETEGQDVNTCFARIRDGEDATERPMEDCHDSGSGTLSHPSNEVYKDLVRWTRPASPPVVKVEVFYNSEYSMPSTHAMSGTAVPFSLFLLTYGRWEYSFIFGLGLALSWSLLVCVSRVYMGMHSVLEVITGFLYSLLILAVIQPALESIDGFYLTSPRAPLVILLLHVSLGLLAFRLDSWSTSRGDTAQALGTGAGAALASHLNHQLGLAPDPPLSQLPLSLPALSPALLGRSLLRLAVGVAVLLATRAAMKALTIPLVCRAVGVSSEDVRQARQHVGVELPYRYIVYGTVGFSCVFLVPLLFDCLNLS
ncbi:hypothetical protein GJAV_G00108920 [Gymnothorax javanicus]|nr:hypothetical protein GJAV_G00108920 [Gymnothorax javanicus]